MATFLQIDPTYLQAMMKAFWLTLRILAGSAGVLFLYAAAFLYEDEERKLYSKLDDFWIGLDDIRKTAFSRTIIFVRVVASIATRTFDRVFGKELISVHFLSVSMYYSVGSLIFMMCLLFIAAFHIRAGAPKLPAAVYIVSALLVFIPFAIGTALWKIRWFIERQIYFVIAPFVPFVLLLFIDSDTKNNPRVMAKAVFYFVAILLLPVLCDLLSILATRSVLRRLEQTNSIVEVVAVLFINGVIVASFMVLPLSVPLLYGQGVPIVKRAASISMLLSFANLTTLLPSLVYIFIAACLILHRLCWPILLRPIYRILSLSVEKKRKLLGLLGLSLLMLALGDKLIDYLKSILGIIFG